MKSIFFLLFITAVSTAANAKSSFISTQSIESGQKTFLRKSVTEGSDSIFAKNEANNLELWKSLDANEDDIISKAEIASAKCVIESWEVLDKNKDGTINFFEFSRVPVKSL